MNIRKCIACVGGIATLLVLTACVSSMTAYTMKDDTLKKGPLTLSIMELNSYPGDTHFSGTAVLTNNSDNNVVFDAAELRLKDVKNNRIFASQGFTHECKPGTSTSVTLGFMTKPGEANGKTLKLQWGDQEITLLRP
ncbi:MAG: hypothetical protein ACOCX9_09445 [Spirochaetota bacterium]